MSTRLEQLAVDIKGPKRGQLLSLTADATTRFVDLTGEATVDGKTTRPFCNKFLTLQAVGDDVYVVLVKEASGNITPGTPSAVDGATKVATPGTAAAWLIPNGSSLDFFMESETTDYKFLAFLAAGAGGKLAIWPSSLPELRR